MSDQSGFPGPSNFPPQNQQPQPFGSPMPPQGMPPQGMPPQTGGYGPPPGMPPQAGGYGPPPGVGPAAQWGTAPLGSWTPGQTPGGGKRRGGLIIVTLVAVVGLSAAAFLILHKGENDANNAIKTANSQIADVLATVPTFTDVSIPLINVPAGVTVPAAVTVPTAVTVPAAVTVPTPVTVPAAVTVPANQTGTTIAVPVSTLPVTTLAVPPTTPADANFFAGTGITDGVAKIATARSASPLRILEANLYTTYLIADVQDPGTPANVDEFILRNGTVGPSAPVDITGGGDLESNLFSDSDVNWNAIPGLVGAALTQIPIEGAKVTHVHVARNLPFSPDIQIRVFVDGTRGSGYLDADAQGNITKVTQP